MEDEIKSIDLRGYKDEQIQRQWKVGNSRIVCVNDIWRWEHHCTFISDNERKFVSLALDPSHIVQIDYMGAISVHPSLLCPDCALHGFVINGSWRQA